MMLLRGVQPRLGIIAEYKMTMSIFVKTELDRVPPPAHPWS